MRLRELSLRNYRVFEEVDLELPAQVIGIFGPNGSGKSTLMEAVVFALYGVDGTRTKKDRIRTQGVLDDCVVRLAFEHAGLTYDVRRSLLGANNRPHAELFVGSKILAAGVQEVDREVARLLRMDLRVFKASVFAEQKQLDAFSDLTSGKRKEMALRLLGIRPVDEARGAARKEARAARQSAEKLAETLADVAALEAELKDAVDERKELQKASEAASEALGAAEKRAVDVRASFEASDALRQKAEKLEVEIKGISARAQDARARRDELNQRLAELDRGLARLPEIEETIERLDGSVQRLAAAEQLELRLVELAGARARLAELPAADLNRLEKELDEAARAADSARVEAAERKASAALARRQLAEAQSRLARADQADPGEPCPTCGRELGGDFEAYVRHCRKEVDDAKTSLAQAERDLKRADRDLRSADRLLKEAAASAEQARGLGDKRRALTATVSELTQVAEALRAAAGSDQPDLEELRSQVGQERELRERAAELRAYSKERARAGGERDELERLVNELAAELHDRTTQLEALGFDEVEHRRLANELGRSEEDLSSARRAEREAVQAHASAAQAVQRLEGQLAQARQTKLRAGELREDARTLDRVASLLDGFRDHLVGRVGPELSREAEALFRELTNHEYDDLKIDDASLAIEIADGSEYFPIQRFSGSEADLANLALRVAISAHLSRVSGTDVGLLVLDEVLGSLDQERKDLMVQAMGRIGRRFHQVFVITHVDQLKDQFPASIEIRSMRRRRSSAVLI